MARSKKFPGVDPAYLEKQKLMLLRRNRAVACVNAQRVGRNAEIAIIGIDKERISPDVTAGADH